MISKKTNERRITLFTGPSGVGKTATVKHALRCMMNETSGLEGSPDVIVEAMRGRVMFFEEDFVNLAVTRNVVAKPGFKSETREKESLQLLTATLTDMPYIILLDDADDEGLKRVCCSTVYSPAPIHTSHLHQALQLLPPSRKGCAIFITSQTLDHAAVMKELASTGDNGASTLVAHEIKRFTPHESLQLLVRACNPHTHRGLYNRLDELKLIMGDGPDPLHHLGHLPLAVRMFVEWVGEQYQRFMRSQTPEHVEAMVERWLMVR